MVVADTSGIMTATVAESETDSEPIELGRYTLAGVQMPAALTSTAITFEVSVRGETYVPLYIVSDDGTTAEASVTVAAGRGYSLPFAWFAQWSFVKIIMGSAEAAERAIDVAVVAV